VAQFLEFKIGADRCRLLTQFRVGPANEEDIAAIQTALSAANFPFSTVAIVAHAIENDAIRSIDG
jgi:hypothetical protein